MHPIAKVFCVVMALGFLSVLLQGDGAGGSGFAAILGMLLIGGPIVLLVLGFIALLKK